VATGVHNRMIEYVDVSDRLKEGLSRVREMDFEEFNNRRLYCNVGSGRIMKTLSGTTLSRSPLYGLFS